MQMPSFTYIKRYLFLLLFISVGIVANAQIIAPDTVQAGTNVSLISNSTGTSYTWTVGNIDLTPTAPPPATTLMSGGLLDIPSFSCTANDNDTWFTFVTNYYSGDLIRLNHGTAPTNTPVGTDLGNFGMNSGISGGIDIIKDPTSGNWFGFVVNGTDMVRLEFGNSLANTPGYYLMSFPGTLAWPHEFKIKQFGKNWIGFAANRSLGIARFDFGASLSNTPASVNLPFANLESPVSFSLINQDNNWYMFVANLTSGSIARLDFGSDIENNNPSSVSLGGFGQLNLVRKIIMVRDCNQLFGYAYNEYSQLFKLDFNNDATNASPAFTTLANIDFNTMELIAFKNEIRAMVINSDNSVFYTSAFKTLDADHTFTNYYNQNQSYTFTTPGTYNISLAIDQGRFMDDRAFCKQIVVVDSLHATAVADVANKQGSLSIFPNPVKQSINVTIPESESFYYDIINSLGQVLLKGDKAAMSKNEVLHIDLSSLNLSTGIYYLVLTDGKGLNYKSRFAKVSQ